MLNASLCAINLCTKYLVVYVSVRFTPSYIFLFDQGIWTTRRCRWWPRWRGAWSRWTRCYWACWRGRGLRRSWSLLRFRCPSQCWLIDFNSFRKHSLLCDGCNISLNPDSKKTGVLRRCSCNTFSSRSEITGGLSSSLHSAPSHLLTSEVIWPHSSASNLRSFCIYALLQSHLQHLCLQASFPPPPVYTAPFSSSRGLSSTVSPFLAVDPSLCMREVCDGCNISFNLDSKETGVPRRCSGNTFSSRSEITGGLRSSLSSSLHHHICWLRTWSDHTALEVIYEPSLLPSHLQHLRLQASFPLHLSTQLHSPLPAEPPLLPLLSGLLTLLSVWGKSVTGAT